LIPDCIKSWSNKKKVILRNPFSTRPWQHVLEVLSGYLFLAYKLKKDNNLHGEAFNFGPRNKINKNVISLVKRMKVKRLPAVSLALSLLIRKHLMVKVVAHMKLKQVKMQRQ